MNSYRTIENKLIKSNKKFISFKQTYDFDDTRGTNPYSQKIRCEIPNDRYENILQLGIRATITLSAPGVSTNDISFLFKSIILREKENGQELFELRPQYTYSRVSKSGDSDTGSYYTAGGLNIAAGDTIGTMNIPVISFLGLTENHYIPVRHLNNLEVVCQFNDSFEKMGFDVDVVRISTKLFVQCTNDDQGNTIPTMIKDSTAVFYEPDIPISNAVAGTTGTIRGRLVCPYACFNVSFLLVDETTVASGLIKKVSLITNNERFVVCDKELNFNFFDSDNHYENTGPFIHWFSKYKKRSLMNGENYGLSTFGSSMRDTYYEIEYELPLASNYVLYAFEDYPTNFEIVNRKLTANDTNEGSLMFGN